MTSLFSKRRTLPVRLIALLALGFLLGLAAVFLYFSPRVAAVQPSAGGSAGGYTAIVARFSTAMDPACVSAHFTLDPAAEGDLTVQGNELRFVPKLPWPAASAVRVTIKAGACSRNRLPLLADFSWSFTPASGRVAYISAPDDRTRLMSVSTSGGDAAELVRAASPIQDFQISPRGDFLVFSTGSVDGPGKIWLAHLAGSAPELLVDCGADACHAPVISPDGARVAYERAKIEALPSGSNLPRSPFVELLNLGNGQSQVISPAGHVASNPVWAPSGWLSYFDADRQAIVVDDLAGGTTFIPNATGESWVWLPDGTGVIFPEITVNGEDITSRFSTSIFSHLILVTLKTNQRRDLSSEAQLEDYSPAVSPDGRWMVFARNFFDSRWTPGRQLWILDLKDFSARQLSQTPDFGYSSIRWSPDGSRLLVMRFHETSPSDPPEIWCLNADGSGAQSLAMGGYLPQWLP
jgi:Tol biopolymer transport system component